MPEAEPTVSPTAEATPTAGPTETPGAENGDLVMFDEFDDPTSGWAVGSLGDNSAAYADGSLRLTVAESGKAIWSSRKIGDEYGVVLVAAAFQPLAVGGVIGLLCSTATVDRYGAALTSNRSVIFFSIVDDVTEALDVREDIGVDLPVGEISGFGLECAGTSTGALRLVAVMQGLGALATYQTDEGPSSFKA